MLFKTAQDLDAFIANALQRGSAAVGNVPGSGSSFLSPLLGQKNPLLEGFGKGFGGHHGAAAAIGDVGSLKWNAVTKHLPAIAALGGGYLLTKSLYDNWQAKQVKNTILKNQELSTRYNPAELNKAVDYIQKYSPSVGRDADSAQDLAKKILLYDSVGIDDIEKLLKVEKAYQESRGAGSQIFSPIGNMLGMVL